MGCMWFVCLFGIGIPKFNLVQLPKPKLSGLCHRYESLLDLEDALGLTNRISVFVRLPYSVPLPMPDKRRYCRLPHIDICIIGLCREEIPLLCLLLQRLLPQHKLTIASCQYRVMRMTLPFKIKTEYPPPLFPISNHLLDSRALSARISDLSPRGLGR
jgi:hypothetical protein